MELEGFGVSLIGRFTWLYGTDQIPWEFLSQQMQSRDFLQSSSHTMKLLLRGPKVSFAETEQDWTCIWHPTQTRDWSCIATLLRSVGVGSCTIVMDHVTPPATFWSFLDSMIREGRTVVTRVWIHEEPPPVLPDATFCSPLATQEESQRVFQVFSAFPARAGHGPWSPVAAWESIVGAACDQGMGLVITDIEEHQWTLLWHRPADSRPPLEKRIPTAQHWLRIGMKCLDT